MTVTVSEQVRDLTNLLHDVNGLLAGHPLGAAFRLLYAPSELDLDAGEVLVQEVDAARRVVQLRPVRLSEVDRRDVLHETQVVNPQDGALIAHAQAASIKGCYMFELGDKKMHSYA
ncbi:hypothetical protein HEP81_01505 [Streptomyces griseofuscus]|uniref:Uncharacterized protein n=1 Tax=Streptomyces griseofuscus TaxID=146922 RepID=A0A7H1PUV4_9ACTN|nr:hypothetical protein [Streptomyces griseofuscus]QNT91834.1 hypothetical protein HEP81_01505 [Streptomyces griseofuscus]